MLALLQARRSIRKYQPPLPAHLKVACIISIDYPAETLKPHPKASLEYDKIHLPQT